MKATEAKLLDFLKKSHQLIVPIYQRTYSWTERECSQLWDDIVNAGRKADVSAHFVGSIVYVEAGLYSVSSQSPLLVIDGQQRSTTVTLLIEALARALGEAEPIDGFSASKLRKRYLINDDEKDERRQKLLLSQTDKATLIAILNDYPAPAEESRRVRDNFEFFQQRLKGLQGELEVVCNGLAKLVIVDISLSRDHDNPQLIFESLNSTGKELSQADLIRNYILMGLPPDLQTKLYELYWRRMEVSFGQEAYQEHFDSFMRHYLTVRTGDIPKVQEVYEKFKLYSRTVKIRELGTEELVREIWQYADYYCAIALDKEPDPELRAAFHDIREMKVDVSYPLLLELYADMQAGLLSREDLLEALRVVESYVFRRAICNIPTNSLNKTFANFTKGLDKTRYLAAIKAQLLLLPSYRRFPPDDEFKRELKQRDLYSFPRKLYLFRRLENFGRKELVNITEYSIEHILPQNPDLSPAWRKELGENWAEVQQRYLHTLGNLTFTGYNSEYSDKPFQVKRDLPETGFRASPLRLNEMLRQTEAWNEGAIQARAELLADKAALVWAAPQMSQAELDQFKPKTAAAGSRYSMADHPLLRTGLVGDLFQEFRRQVLELDPCVTEEFWKSYVAFKAETSITDVYGQAKRLKVAINLKVGELNDPRGICSDMSEKGHFGNGDFEFALDSFEDMAYAIGLVRQALEKQMGGGSEG